MRKKGWCEDTAWTEVQIKREKRGQGRTKGEEQNMAKTNMAVSIDKRRDEGQMDKKRLN